jgi:hypothetical protein
MAETYTLQALHKLTVAHTGDQGGFIGSGAYLFSSRDKAHAWFKQAEWNHGGESFIYEEKAVRALVAGDGKTCFPVEGGPYTIKA